MIGKPPCLLSSRVEGTIGPKMSATSFSANPRKPFEGSDAVSEASTTDEVVRRPSSDSSASLSQQDIIETVDVAEPFSPTSTSSLKLNDVRAMLRGISCNSCEDISKLVLLAPESEQLMLAAMRESLLSSCGAPLPDDDFLLLCLRCWRYQEQKATSIANNFVLFRRAANWPFNITATDVQRPLSTGMHWLLPDRDVNGRRVLVYNARFLKTQTCGIADYQKMGCYIMQEVMKDLDTVDRGITVVVDLQDLNPMAMMSSMNVGDMQRGIAMWRDAYPCKLKQIFLVHMNFVARKLVQVAMAALSTKVRGRIVCVDSDLSQLHASIPPTSLPKSLGGTGEVGWEEWCNQRLAPAAQHEQEV